MVSPLHEHDCEDCKFLGNFEDQHGRYDLYFCPQHGAPTLIARWSSNGPDYMSGLVFGRQEYQNGERTPLAAAYEQAVLRGLLRTGDERGEHDMADFQRLLGYIAQLPVAKISHFDASAADSKRNPPKKE